MTSLITWDAQECHVDLDKELQNITAQAPEGEEVKNGERLIQFASENLVTEVLIHPQLNTLVQCMRNCLSSFTRHRHIIHAGYTSAGNGAWVLQDGTYSFSDFADMYSEHEVQRVLRAYEGTVSVDVHCSGEGDWWALKAKDPFSKVSRVRLNPPDKGSTTTAVRDFLNYLSQYLVPAGLTDLLEPSDVVGNIRFSHPTLYVFPGGQGDAALFGINGFNMLVDGGFSRKACFWDFTRHLDRLDSVLMTRINNGNLQGLASLLKRKKSEQVYPQIGHFFSNIPDRKQVLSPDGDKDRDPLLINLIEQGQEMLSGLRHLGLKPQACYREPSVEPINLYHKVGHGKLDMYVLSPAKDSREVREFLAKWAAVDSKIFCSYSRKGEFNFPLSSKTSICALLVWQPANPEDNITRLLFPGSTPQQKIFEGLDRLKNLEFMKHPICSAKSLSPTSSTIKLSIKPTPKPAIIEKVAEIEKKQSETVKAVKQVAEVKKSTPPPPKPKPKADRPKEKPKTDLDSKPETVKIDRKTTEAVQKVEKEIKKEKPKRTMQKPQEKKTQKPPEKKMDSVKSSPTTPKKTVENKLTEMATTRTEIKTRASRAKASPTSTPAKSAKEENNRKVVELKSRESTKLQKAPPTKREEPKKIEKSVGKKPIASPKGVKSLSPIKAAKSSTKQRLDVKKTSKTEKDIITDSSAVSTPSTVDAELTKAKEEAEKTKEISESKPEDASRKASEDIGKSISKEDDDEILIIEKLEISDEVTGKADVEKIALHLQKLDEGKKRIPKEQQASAIEEKETADTTSQEKPAGETMPSPETKQVAQDEIQDIIETATEIVTKRLDIQKTDSQEISGKDLGSTDKIVTPREKDLKSVDVEQKIDESQPDEKFSTTVESGATTTAPTLPEDERIPLDEIKEGIEEKHAKEETKEKEIIATPRPEQPTSLPQVPVIAGTVFDQRAQLLKDIVKTPDEVADLPVHEEVDVGIYEGAGKDELLSLPQTKKEKKDDTTEELKLFKDNLEKEDKSKDLKEDMVESVDVLSHTTTDLDMISSSQKSGKPLESDEKEEIQEDEKLEYEKEVDKEKIPGLVEIEKQEKEVKLSREEEQLLDKPEESKEITEKETIESKEKEEIKAPQVAKLQLEEIARPSSAEEIEETEKDEGVCLDEATPQLESKESIPTEEIAKESQEVTRLEEEHKEEFSLEIKSKDTKVGEKLLSEKEVEKTAPEIVQEAQKEMTKVVGTELMDEKLSEKDILETKELIGKEDKEDHKKSADDKKEKIESEEAMDKELEKKDTIQEEIPKDEKVTIDKETKLSEPEKTQDETQKVLLEPLKKEEITLNKEQKEEEKEFQDLKPDTSTVKQEASKDIFEEEILKETLTLKDKTLASEIEESEIIKEIGTEEVTRKESIDKAELDKVILEAAKTSDETHLLNGKLTEDQEKLEQIAVMEQGIEDMIPVELKKTIPDKIEAISQEEIKKTDEQYNDLKKIESEPAISIKEEIKQPKEIKEAEDKKEIQLTDKDKTLAEIEAKEEELPGDVSAKIKSEIEESIKTEIQETVEDIHVQKVLTEEIATEVKEDTKLIAEVKKIETKTESTETVTKPTTDTLLDQKHLVETKESEDLEKIRLEGSVLVNGLIKEEMALSDNVSDSLTSDYEVEQITEDSMFKIQKGELESVTKELSVIGFEPDDTGADQIKTVASSSIIDEDLKAELQAMDLTTETKLSDDMLKHEEKSTHEDIKDEIKPIGLKSKDEAKTTEEKQKETEIKPTEELKESEIKKIEEKKETDIKAIKEEKESEIIKIEGKKETEVKQTEMKTTEEKTEVTKPDADKKEDAKTTTEELKKSDIKKIEEKKEDETKQREEKMETEFKSSNEKTEFETKLPEDKKEAEFKSTEDQKESEIKPIEEKAASEIKLTEKKTEAETEMMEELKDAEIKTTEENKGAEIKKIEEKTEVEIKTTEALKESAIKKIEEKEEAEIQSTKELKEAEIIKLEENKETEQKKEEGHTQKESEIKEVEETVEAEIKPPEEKKDTEIKKLEEEKEAELKQKEGQEESEIKKIEEKIEDQIKPTEEKKESEIKPSEEKKESEIKPSEEKKESEIKSSEEKKDSEIKTSEEKKESEIKPSQEKKESEIKPTLEQKESETKKVEETIEPGIISSEEQKEFEIKQIEKKVEAETKTSEEKKEEDIQSIQDSEKTEKKTEVEMKPIDEKKEVELKATMEKIEAKIKPIEEKEEVELKTAEEKIDTEIKPIEEKKETEIKSTETEIKAIDKKEEFETKFIEEKTEPQIKTTEEKTEAVVKPSEKEKETETKSLEEKKVVEKKTVEDEKKSETEEMKDDIKKSEEKKDSETKPTDVKKIAEIKSTEVIDDKKDFGVKNIENQKDAEIKSIDDQEEDLMKAVEEKLEEFTKQPEQEGLDKLVTAEESKLGTDIKKLEGIEPIEEKEDGTSTKPSISPQYEKEERAITESKERDQVKQTEKTDLLKIEEKITETDFIQKEKEEESKQSGIKLDKENDLKLAEEKAVIEQVKKAELKIETETDHKTDGSKKYDRIELIDEMKEVKSSLIKEKEDEDSTDIDEIRKMEIKTDAELKEDKIQLSDEKADNILKSDGDKKINDFKSLEEQKETQLTSAEEKKAVDIKAEDKITEDEKKSESEKKEIDLKWADNKEAGLKSVEEGYNQWKMEEQKDKIMETDICKKGDEMKPTDEKKEIQLKSMEGKKETELKLVEGKKEIELISADDKIDIVLKSLDQKKDAELKSKEEKEELSTMPSEKKEPEIITSTSLKEQEIELNEEKKEAEIKLTKENIKLEEDIKKPEMEPIQTETEIKLVEEKCSPDVSKEETVTKPTDKIKESKVTSDEETKDLKSEFEMGKDDSKVKLTDEDKPGSDLKLTDGREETEMLTEKIEKEGEKMSLDEIKPTEGKEKSETKLTGENKEVEIKPSEENKDAEIKLSEEKKDSEIKPPEEKKEVEIKTVEEKKESEIKPSEEKKESEIKPSEEKKESEIKPSKEKEDSEIKPSEEKKESEIKPPEEKKESEIKPSEEKKESEIKPSEEKEESEIKPSKENEDSEIKPSEEKKESEIKPPEEKKESEIKPSEEKKESEIKPSEEKKESEIKPSKEKKKSEIKPSEEKKESEIKPSEEKKESEIKPSEEKEESEIKPSEEKEESEIKLSEEKFLLITDQETKDTPVKPSDDGKITATQSDNENDLLEAGAILASKAFTDGMMTLEKKDDIPSIPTFDHTSDNLWKQEELMLHKSSEGKQTESMFELGKINVHSEVKIAQELKTTDSEDKGIEEILKLEKGFHEDKKVTETKSVEEKMEGDITLLKEETVFLHSSIREVKPTKTIAGEEKREFSDFSLEAGVLLDNKIVTNGQKEIESKPTEIIDKSMSLKAEGMETISTKSQTKLETKLMEETEIDTLIKQKEELKLMSSEEKGESESQEKAKELDNKSTKEVKLLELTKSSEAKTTEDIESKPKEDKLELDLKITEEKDRSETKPGAESKEETEQPEDSKGLEIKLTNGNKEEAKQSEGSRDTEIKSTDKEDSVDKSTQEKEKPTTELSGDKEVTEIKTEYEKKDIQEKLIIDKEKELSQRHVEIGMEKSSKAEEDFEFLEESIDKHIVQRKGLFESEDVLGETSKTVKDHASTDRFVMESSETKITEKRESVISESIEQQTKEVGLSKSVATEKDQTISEGFIEYSGLSKFSVENGYQHEDILGEFKELKKSEMTMKSVSAVETKTGDKVLPSEGSACKVLATKEKEMSETTSEIHSKETTVLSETAEGKLEVSSSESKDTTSKTEKLDEKKTDFTTTTTEKVTLTEKTDIIEGSSSSRNSVVTAGSGLGLPKPSDLPKAEKGALDSSIKEEKTDKIKDEKLLTKLPEDIKEPTLKKEEISTASFIKEIEITTSKEHISMVDQKINERLDTKVNGFTESKVTSEYEGAASTCKTEGSSETMFKEHSDISGTKSVQKEMVVQETSDLSSSVKVEKDTANADLKSKMQDEKQTDETDTPVDPVFTTSSKDTSADKQIGEITEVCSLKHTNGEKFQSEQHSTGSSEASQLSEKHDDTHSEQTTVFEKKTFTNGKLEKPKEETSSTTEIETKYSGSGGITTITTITKTVTTTTTVPEEPKDMDISKAGIQKKEETIATSETKYSVKTDKPMSIEQKEVSSTSVMGGTTEKPEQVCKVEKIVTEKHEIESVNDVSVIKSKLISEVTPALSGSTVYESDGKSIIETKFKTETILNGSSSEPKKSIEQFITESKSISSEIQDSIKLASSTIQTEETIKTEKSKISLELEKQLGTAHQDKTTESLKEISGASSSYLSTESKPDTLTDISMIKDMTASFISTERWTDRRADTPGGRATPSSEATWRESDDDLPASPLSTTSHLHSPPPTMYSSMYVQDDDSDISFGKPDIDFETAAREHVQTRGETLPKDPIEKWGKPLGLPPPPSGKDYWSPFKEWGRPLHLPSPAPAPAENDTEDTSGSAKTTPKKVAKMNEENNRYASNIVIGKEANSKNRRSDSPVKRNMKDGKKVGMGHIYLDLSYVPHHGNSHYANVEFFKRVRARYYVFSGTEPSKEVFNALLEAKQQWEDKDLEVTIIPTYDTDTLGYWIAENEETLSKYKIDLSPSASRCTINLQDHDTSCSAYRLEF